MRTFSAKLIAKAARRASIAAGKRGTDLPGQLARRIDPHILRKLASSVDAVVFISGTNGKTTTSNLIGHTLKTNHIQIVHNTEGANMAAGITSSFIVQTKRNTKLAIIEIDEGSIPRVLSEMTPTMMVFTNFFRDQMDRFGEIDILVDGIADHIKGKGIKLLLNADDPFVSRLKIASDDVVYYGMKAGIHHFEESTMIESKYCPNCGRLLDYSAIHYNQLGHYTCDCGFNRAVPKYEIEALAENPYLVPVINGETFNMKLAGDFNVFNIIAAYSVLKELGLTDEAIRKGFESYASDNGRMQYFTNGRKEAIINLAKNPAGLNASLSVGEKIEGQKSYLISLNDNGADGRDISWIWDADFEKLERQTISRIYCTGNRAEELAVRLKYAEINVPVEVIRDIPAATKAALMDDAYTVCIPNYTSLEPMHRTLTNFFKEGN
ncbi:Mur ligase family protein [Macrococcus equipercicus]|uniref:Lipid II isoglutaminyl synthase (glutamine-hydrolyzing) subunit MurT n=1 Tax=Macrococcus equipercicus TaxID=69967 RepID=A0A9Q9BVY6_9STAP|nr:Mur ligase family protein [Macrococcus equipercicus]KAA1037690.1 Mur ligase family protein [Macrococcus equipercicus]UTH13402.1 Mur ligase family protein [Macrococcus equipercicus]